MPLARVIIIKGVRSVVYSCPTSSKKATNQSQTTDFAWIHLDTFINTTYQEDSIVIVVAYECVVHAIGDVL